MVELDIGTVIRELSEETWKVRVRKGEDESMPLMPTMDDLRDAMVEGELDSSLNEFEERLGAVKKAVRGVGVVGPEVQVVTDQFGLAVIADGVRTKLGDGFEDRASEIIVAFSLASYHDMWRAALKRDSSVKHPLVPLITGWFVRPEAIRPSRSRAGVIPSTMASARGQVYMPGLAPAEAPLGEQGRIALLPSFMGGSRSVIPTNPIKTWRAGGGTAKRRGRGAPLALRTFFELLTMPSYEDRRSGGRREVRLTLGQYRDIHYSRMSNGRSSYRQHVDLDKIRDALWEVDQMRVETVIDGYKVATLWRPIGISALPKADLDSPIVAHIQLPPGSARGAMVDKSALRYFGRKSSLQYVAALGLAYYWDHYGTHRKSKRPIMATRPLIARSSEGLALGTDSVPLLDGRGKPITGFSDSRLVFLDVGGKVVEGGTVAERRSFAARERNPSVERYPLLYRQDLIMLCYPESADDLTATVLRSQLYRSRKALDRMESLGYCVIEETEGELGEEAYRILPVSWGDFSPED